ncbi:MAG: hypothetical protein A3F84_04320 [Candidatus Handelsmanbacteria bacterium RIFCSPLOWO2_12_FULL_64_10]|uniref:HTH luxR-type domain-containing protein n=1 Tax=Handelsmanbacteria sp. (strain RIFCSPLOWO2_12_FULL_64_10) TaxID=1817868 RepID=A0A1F6D2W7_HANXR|nr:MAG: hypothetical protein A3F84_04320 [Candidatus Handelsmanbacteria bacterium RIFCSPLOWO2_12_FULL_64_10]
MATPRERTAVRRVDLAVSRADQRASHQYARWIRELFSRTSDAVFAVGPDFHILWWSPQAEQLLGIPARHAVGQLCYQLIAGQHSGRRARCGPDCWVMRATREGRSVPTFDLQIGAAASESDAYSVGFLSDDPGTLLIHLLRPLGNPQGFTMSAPLLDASEVEPAAATRKSTVQRLTPREREVLGFILAGSTSQDIATELCISRATARNHVQRVLTKLGVHSRLDAAMLAIQAGLGPARPVATGQG